MTIFKHLLRLKNTIQLFKLKHRTTLPVKDLITHTAILLHKNSRPYYNLRNSYRIISKQLHNLILETITNLNPKLDFPYRADSETPQIIQTQRGAYTGLRLIDKTTPLIDLTLSNFRKIQSHINNTLDWNPRVTQESVSPTLTTKSISQASALDLDLILNLLEEIKQNWYSISNNLMDIILTLTTINKLTHPKPNPLPTLQAYKLHFQPPRIITNYQQNSSTQNQDIP